MLAAVLLALGATEFRDSHLKRKAAWRSFEAIRQEVEANLELIKPDSADHAQKLVRVQQWLDAAEDQRDTIGIDFEILHSLTKSTAWEVAKLNQIVPHMTDTLVMDVSRVYTMQKFYDSGGRQMYGKMTDIIMDMGDESLSKGAVRAFGFELIKEYSSVLTLKGVYEEFLEKYGSVK